MAFDPRHNNPADYLSPVRGQCGGSLGNALKEVIIAYLLLVT